MRTQMKSFEASWRASSNRSSCVTVESTGPGREEDSLNRLRAQLGARLPLVKDGVEWGWLNFTSFDGESLRRHKLLE